MRALRWIGLGVLGVWVAACNRGEDAQATRPEANPASEVKTVAAPAPKEPPAADVGPQRVHYDLAAHLARGELFHGEAQVLDMGVPGGAKHCLGGWQTRVGDDVQVEGASASVISSTTGRLMLWLDEAPTSAQVLMLRLRAPGSANLVLHVNGEPLGTLDAPRHAFGVVRVDVPAEAMSSGMNVLQLRVSGRSHVTGVGRVGMLLDWIRLGPPDATAAQDPPAPDTLLRRRDDEARLHIPAEWALGATLHVPEGAHLVADVNEGALDVRVDREGHPPVAMAEGVEGAVRLSLERFAGAVVRVRLAASGSEPVVLRRPAIMEPDPGGNRRLRRRPRHVLIYLIDTLRADKLRAYNPHTRVRTPGFSKHAESAALFMRGMTQENWTKPSVATLLTALMPWEHHASSGEAVLPASVEILPETLRGHGYFTGAFIANGFVSGKFGFRQGWHTWRNYIREGRRTQARFVAADVLDWLDKRPQDEPFFLYVHTIDPHVPYIPPNDLLDEYDPEPYTGPIDFTRDRQILEKIKVGSIDPDARDRRRLEALYDGEITYHDVHFGSILEGLERRGLLDDTMVVVTADHGEELFDHGSVGHGHSVWQELLHVPLSMHVPGLTEGGVRIDGPVGLVDVVPTVLDVLGLPAPEESSGRSLLPLLEGRVETAPQVTVSAFMNGWRTVVVGDLKLVHRTHATAKVYDLATDPGETEDLIAQRPLTGRYLQGMLGLALRGALGATAGALHEAQETEIDPETEAQLRALGYVGTSRR